MVLLLLHLQVGPSILILFQINKIVVYEALLSQPNCGQVLVLHVLYFPVTGCDECIEPVNKTIMCDPSGKPVINFCLKNLDPVAVQFFGITIPTNIQYTTVSLPSGATLIYTHPTNGMRVYRTDTQLQLVIQLVRLDLELMVVSIKINNFV